jgi:hypothetical protein
VRKNSDDALLHCKRLRPGRPGVGVGVFLFVEVGMRIRQFFLGAALTAVLAAPASAQVATKKFPWQPVGGVQNIDLQTESVAVGQVVFDLGSTLKGTPIRKSSAKVRVRIDNNSETDEEVGVAVVVFDAEGNVVAAGSNGTKWGYLNKGDRTYYDIDFPYVYRRLDEAANFMVTLETKQKPAKKSKASKSTSTVEPEPTPIP